MPIAVASGVVLECLHGNSFCGLANSAWAWLHVAASSVLTILVIWHIRLHWNNASNWYKRYRQHHSRGFKYAGISFLATVLTGLPSIPIWLLHGHAGFGGLHGKIGFICAFFMLGHVIRHREWYSRNTHK